VVNIIQEVSESAPKKAVYYIGSQDTSGFTGVVEKMNTIGTTFTFNRDGAGTFLCGDFDYTKHFLSFSARMTAGVYNTAFYQTADNEFKCMEFDLNGSGTLSDSVFANGGWIKIEEY